MSATVEYAFLVAALGIFGSAVYFSQVVRPRNIENGLRNAAGFHADIVHIGITSGIGFDFRSQQFAYCHGGAVKIFPAVEFFDWEPASNPVTNSSGEITGYENFIVIYTDNYDTPTFSIDFGRDKKKALQCIISLRHWIKHIAAQMQIGQQSSLTNEPAESSEKVDPAIIAVLQKRVSENGFSRADANSNVKLRRRKEAVELLWRSYETWTGKPRKWGFRANITEALCPIFERMGDDPDGFGYTKGSFSNSVNSDIKTLKQSDEQKQLERLRHAAMKHNQGDA